MFTPLEQKLWRLALDKAAAEGEFSNAIIKLVKSLRARGYSSYDNPAPTAASNIDRATEERIRNAAYKAGYAEGTKKGGVSPETLEQTRVNAYSQGYNEGRNSSAVSPEAMMNAYSAGFRGGREHLRSSWGTRAKIIAMYAVLAALVGGLFFWPHEKPVLRATLIALPKNYI
jgi:hypothetical protein